nr:hypothetical protein [Deltaproteobacteria bacterium]
TTAYADAPKSSAAAVDISAYKDKLVVYQDATGASYVVSPRQPGEVEAGTARVFFGRAKTMYAHPVMTAAASGEDGEWSVTTWTAFQIAANKAQTALMCDPNDPIEKGVPLTLLTADKAKAFLAGAKFVTSPVDNFPYALGRDGTTYYLITRFEDDKQTRRYKLFAGKKAAIKEVVLADTIADEAGVVLVTKTESVKLDPTTRTMVVKRKTADVKLDKIDASFQPHLAMVFREFGIYPSGTIPCGK